MLIITIQINAPADQAMGVKEDLALYLEQYGDAKVIAIEQQPGKQIKIGAWTDAKEQMSGMRRRNHLDKNSIW